ncbi:MAG: alpha/beta hydrolase [Bacteroidia bacterium]
MHTARPILAVPGLGTDGRLFGPLSAHLPIGVVPWIEPLAGESLQDYARRMAAPHPPGAVWLGVSFGGVLAQTIAAVHPVSQVLLVSSLRSPGELPPSLRLMRHLPLYRLARGGWRIRTLPWWAPAFGVRDPREQAVLRAMFAAATDSYRMWAIHSLVHWQPLPIDLPVARLHGTRDRVLPTARVGQTDWLEGGTHFMVYQRAVDVAAWVRQRLRTTA